MRFVILEHQHQDHATHWDLMLEQAEGLKTFRLNQPPLHLTDTACLVTLIFDHPFRFLTYEGPVQQGKGQVKRVESGTYETIEQTPDFWVVRLRGTQIQGEFKLPLQQEDTLIVAKIY